MEAGGKLLPTSILSCGVGWTFTIIYPVRGLTVKGILAAESC
jgi:hypothetical protein